MLDFLYMCLVLVAVVYCVKYQSDMSNICFFLYNVCIHEQRKGNAIVNAENVFKN